MVTEAGMCKASHMQEGRVSTVAAVFVHHNELPCVYTPLTSFTALLLLRTAA